MQPLITPLPSASGAGMQFAYRGVQNVSRRSHTLSGSRCGWAEFIRARLEDWSLMGCVSCVDPSVRASDEQVIIQLL